MHGQQLNRRYATADVFTSSPFEGNPVAVVLDADGLSSAQMQKIAIEFGYAETTFVLPPTAAKCTAQVRIFTPDRELPFAGHPNIGTAFVLALQAEKQGVPLPDNIVFEQIAGEIPIRFLKDGETVIGAELITPEGFSSYSKVSAKSASLCLSIDPYDVRTEIHEPQIASVGLPFLIVELNSRKALRRCKPNSSGFNALLPLDGATSVYAYTRDVDSSDSPRDIEARMFTRRMTEDPATGSATAAASALIAHIQRVPNLSLRVGQGTDMGRPSLLFTDVQTTSEGAFVRLGGHCVSIMEGKFFLKNGV